MKSTMVDGLRFNPVPLLVLLIGVLPSCKSGTGPVLANGDAKFSGVAPLQATTTDGKTYDIDFGQIAVGLQGNGALTLVNDGSSPLQILSVGAPSDPQFQVTLAGGTNLDQGSQINVPVSFKPFSAGAKSATVVLTTDSESTPTLTLSFTGTGVNLKLSVTPQVLDFGSVVVHSQRSLDVTIENQSTLDVTVTPGAVVGNNAPLFTTSATGPIPLPANGMATIQVTFTPLTPSADADDLASFTLTSTAGDDVTVNLKGKAVQSGLCYSSPLDFSFVEAGTALTKTLKISNCGNQSIMVTSATVVNPGMPQAAFSATPASGTLQPGDELDIPVTFQPINAARYTGELDVISNDNNGQIPVVLQGYGGGAQISCSPGVLDFGLGGVGFTTTLPIICTNTGTDVYLSDGRTIDPMAELNFGALKMSNPAFSAAFNSDQVAGAVSLRASKSILIDVSYSPLGTETDTGTLTILSNVLNPPAPPVIALSGSGVKEDKCYYSLSPTTLNFGQVTPLVPFVDGFTITNVGPNECLVTGLNLTTATDMAFTLPNGPIVSALLSPPSGGSHPTSLTVPVRFDPPQTGTYVGAVAFTITDPDGPNQVVALGGVGGSSCLVLKPDPLNFSTVGLSAGQYCQSGKLKFTLVNACATDATVSSINFSAGNPPFQILTSPSLPLVVAKGTSSTPIVVGFKPTAAGKYYGSIQVTSDVTDQPIVEFMNASANDGSSQTDQFVQHTPQADILWVVDTDDDFDFWSGPQSNFFPQLQDFMNAAAGVDYQMAVTTVETCPGGDQGNIEPCPSCHNTSYNGSSDADILTPDLSNPGADLQNLLNNIDKDPCNPCQDCNSCCAPGSADEHFLQAAQWALDPTNAAAAHNSGFLRPDAFLSLILVNGDVEDDYSPDTWQSYVQFFQGLKPDASLFTVNYLISDPSAFVSAYPNLTAMVKETGGILVDTSNQQWAKPMAALWGTVLASSTIFPLSGTADPSSVTVYLAGPPPDQANGQPPGVQIQAGNPNGSWNWKYDPTTNAVLINAQVIPLTNGDPLFIEYTLTCS
jgi:Abnormal spindle-like microcephaly-assoc'd, ASPM-SPD-2-Hydin